MTQIEMRYLEVVPQEFRSISKELKRANDLKEKELEILEKKNENIEVQTTMFEAINDSIKNNW